MATNPAPHDEIGLLYSTATGIVLRTINPGHGERFHLDWLQKNLPKGTTLLRLNKLAIGADDDNCPNLDYLIPYVKQLSGINLSFGIPCSVLDSYHRVINFVVCCPVLYQAAIKANPKKANWSLIQNLAGDVGDIYDPVTQTFAAPLPAENLY